MRPHFGILDRIHHADVEEGIVGDLGNLTCFEARTAEDLPASIGELDAVVVWHELAITADILHRLKNCLVVVRAGVGYDSVDLPTASALGIPVVNVPDYGTNDVADHTLMLILAAARRLPLYDRALRSDPAANWVADLGGAGMRRLTGRHVGIVGFGRIGTAVAHRVRAFGCDISFFDPFLPDGVDKSWQVTRCATLEELITAADIICLHTPLSAATAGLINAQLLSHARPGAILINTSRGGVVDLDAVYEALRSGALAAFAADVLPAEPPDPAHPLLAAFTADAAWQRGRVVVTPHAAFYSDDCERELRIKSTTAMVDAWHGRPLRNCVNLSDLVAPRSAVARNGTPS